jgi:serine/threonine protein kinase/formylglycine-generating enzyme required for sulfatase activity
MENLTGKQLNQYQIVAPLGEGGMAALYKAYQPVMDRYVALKVLPRQLARDSQFLGRFEQEAKVIASLQHPHILPVFDYGEVDDYTFIVMPFVETGTLSDILGQPLPLVRIQKIASQVGDALDYAHSRGIIHRDIKPSNILIDERGNCLLADFGIAKMVEGTTQFTQTGGIVGTPAYMSPEQGLGQKPDGRSDIYSFGVILYEMATGRPPYQAETPMAVVIKHIHDPLPPPRTINPQISGAFERIILKALAKNREDRYSSCTDVVLAIQALTKQAPVPTSKTVDAAPAIATLIEPPVLEQPSQSAISSKLSSISPVEQTRPRQRWLLWGIIMAGMIGFGVIVILVAWYLSITLLDSGNDQPVAELSLSTPTETLVGIIPPTQTNTPVPINTEIPTSTDTPAPTQAPTIPPEPTLGVGDTLVSPMDGSVMVFVPAGEFLLGAGENDPAADPDELPQRSVYLDAFWIDRYEITNRQYQVCVTAGKCFPPNSTESATRYSYYGDSEFDDYPVINVTWVDALTYCQWRGANLPTEAQWEKAARGDLGVVYPWGDSFETSASNYCASTILCPDEPEDGFKDTAPVGSFESGASPYGVYDMAGNVNEWLADWYDASYYAGLTEGVENPQGPDNGEKRGIRGGSFGLNAWKLRTTNRGSGTPSHYGPYDGFRCVQPPD